MISNKNHNASRPSIRIAGRLALVLLMALVAGCGNRKPPPAPTTAEASEALKAALDAWQQGVPIDSLINRHPPILVTDYEWDDKKTLLGYYIQGDGEIFGPTVRLSVLLVLEGTPGQPVNRQVVYDVATRPKISVVREDP